MRFGVSIVAATRAAASFNSCCGAKLICLAAKKFSNFSF
ncbi:hypothetical protein ASZ90_003120 [hydrocarbon metagenome]|uniref:Uncharacterized protein n=1 Tax=hydrocarbon metagenome TaxID=938273 RepID=A0A0W8G1K6_9ZZZZ